jgi:chemotaxis protein MotA
MNFTFPAGLGLALVAVYLMVTLEEASFASLFLPAPLILVFGVTIGIGIMANPFKEWLAAVKSVPGAVFKKLPSPVSEIEKLIELAEIARRPDRGLIALENEAETIDEPLLKASLIDMASGIDSEALRGKMVKNVRATVGKRRLASGLFTSMAGTAPTVGIIGTVISLTHVLANLSSPDTLGPMISSAFVATLWGLTSANVIWMPIGEKLGRIATLEQQRLQVIVEGCVQILDGTSPRDLRDILEGMTNPAGGAGKKGDKGKEKVKKEKKPGKSGEFAGDS